VVDHTTANFGPQILAEEWVGIEYRIKMSAPHGTANGEHEIWIYDESGTIIATDLETGVLNFNDGNTALDHNWNKFVWGGNRKCPPVYADEFGDLDTLYIDDVIINSGRIGPTYFTLVEGSEAKGVVCAGCVIQ
jgi:hypothetical protein